MSRGWGAFLRLWLVLFFAFVLAKLLFNLVVFGWIDLRFTAFVEMLVLPLVQSAVFWMITRRQRMSSKGSTASNARGGIERQGPTVRQPASTQSVRCASLSAGSDADETEALVERMIDPLNRWYRYPAARWVLPHVRRTHVTPNQLTLLHTAVGLAAAAWLVRGSASARIGACLLYELRLVVDCLDGELARATDTATPYGRTLDALGDAVSYVALCAALAVVTGASMLALGVLVTGALMAWIHDFYARKFSTALRSGADSIYEELRAKHAAIAAQGAGFVIRFGYAFDWLQIVFLAPHSRRTIAARLRDPSAAGDAAAAADVRYIIAQARSCHARAAFRATSMMATDNVLAILNVGLLMGRLVAAEWIVLLYGMVTATAGLILCRRFLKHAGAAAA